VPAAIVTELAGAWVATLLLNLRICRQFQCPRER
jgi:hypothetical protein